MKREILKQRLREGLKRMGITPAELAEVLDVSERTVQRWLSPRNRMLPDVGQLAKVAEHWRVSLDTLLLSDRFSQSDGQVWGEHRPGRIPFERLVFDRIPAVWVNAEWDVLHCTQAFARLYEVEAAEMIEKNLHRDFASYGETGYESLDQGRPNARVAFVCTIREEADMYGESGSFCWFVARDGHCRRILMRCWALGEGTYLFVNTPAVRLGWDLYERVLHADGTDYTYSLRNPNGRSITVPQKSQDCLHFMMNGWDTGRIARETGLSRSGVVECLRQWCYAFEADDLDHLREILTHYIAEEFLPEHYGILRCNAGALK
jgi:transcriptional regulator with XRE-family HTH domain